MSFYSMRNPESPHPFEQEKRWASPDIESDDGREREPYCECDLELTQEEIDRGKCAHCGGRLL